MDRTKGLLTLALIVVALAGTAGFVARTQGNLAWDDADYLRRGLRIANRAASAGPIRAVDDFLRERPKPPLLVGWIAASASIGGRHRVLPLILASSVVPFGLLLIGVALLARRLYGPTAPGLAVLAALAAPATVALGVKVMVETALALAILLTLGAATLLLQRPTPRRGLLLGAAIGMALMTKMTVPLLLAGPFVAFIVLYLGRHGLDRRAATTLATILLGLASVAGPWYGRNGRAAVEFARYSSRYNIEAEGRSDRVSTPDRLTALAGQVAGWPNLAMLAIGAGVWLSRRTASSLDPDRPEAEGRRTSCRPGADFAILASAALGCGAIGLTIPTYFDPRFLAPAWPAMAVALAGLLAPRGRCVSIAAVLVLGAGASWSFAALRHEPRTTTYWAARDLIDEMVERHGVHRLGNVGDTGDWNVCKTGLVNELRPVPGDCHVLQDLSRAAPESLADRLARLDAVVILDDSPLLDDMRRAAPGLNRAREAIGPALAASGRFVRVEAPSRASLPPMRVYVRR